MRSIQVLERDDTGLFHFISPEWAPQFEQERIGRLPNAIDISLAGFETEEELCSALSSELGLPGYASWGPVLDQVQDLSEENEELLIIFQRADSRNIGLQKAIIEMFSCASKFWADKEKRFHIVFVENG